MSGRGVAARLRRIVDSPGVAAAAFLPALVFAFVPAQIYGANAPYLPYTLLQYLGVFAPALAASVAVLVLAVGVGSDGWRSKSAAVVSGVAFAAWVGATFLVTQDRLLDGRTPLAAGTGMAAAWNAVAYALAAAAAGLAALRRPGVARKLFAAFLAILAAQVAWIAAHDEKDVSAPAFAARERIASLSPERNVVLILLDSLQSDFFAELVEREPSLAQAFDGFTYHRNAVSPAPSTYVSVPALHSGTYIRDGQDMRVMYREGVVRDSFLAQLAARGYDAMLLNPVLGACPKGALCVNAPEVLHGQERGLRDSALFVLGLAVYRIAPEVLKPRVLGPGGVSWFRPPKADDPESSNAVLELVAQKAAASSARPVARFLHLFSTHAPARVDASCAPVEAESWTRQAALEQDRCALARVAAVLQALRDKGLYDQTAIAVVADHGRSLPRDAAARFPWNTEASPLLLLKPFGARGPMKASETLVGLADVPASLCAWTGDCRTHAGEDVAAANRAEPRYPFVAYEWRHEYWNKAAFPIADRYELRGPPDRIASWLRLTNTPGSALRRLDFGPGDQATAYGFGWGDAETGGGLDWRWSLGEEADLYLDLDESADARLAIKAHTHAGNPAQVMAMSVNGTHVARLPVGVNWATHEVPVPATALRPGADRILFRFEQANRPPGDSRRLAVRFERLEVR